MLQAADAYRGVSLRELPVPTPKGCDHPGIYMASDDNRTWPSDIFLETPASERFQITESSVEMVSHMGLCISNNPPQIS
jgi:hypothetical protein